MFFILLDPETPRQVWKKAGESAQEVELGMEAQSMLCWGLDHPGT